MANIHSFKVNYLYDEISTDFCSDSDYYDVFTTGEFRHIDDLKCIFDYKHNIISFTTGGVNSIMINSYGKFVYLPNKRITPYPTDTNSILCYDFADKSWVVVDEDGKCIHKFPKDKLKLENGVYQLSKLLGEIV